MQKCCSNDPGHLLGVVLKYSIKIGLEKQNLNQIGQTKRNERYKGIVEYDDRKA